MCGIVGILNRNNQPVDFHILQRMSDKQRHRGPDDQSLVGFSFAKKDTIRLNHKEKSHKRSGFHGGLGFNRLSILDLSMNGRQPMISNNRQVIIAYNGEAYNAFTFKKFLVEKGICFKSSTDTEILLYLYQEYGIKKLLELINGMFALCIVDLMIGKIFLARDHAGIKPLYWYTNGNTILFASEIKAFYKHPDFIAELNNEHVDEYAILGYTAHDRTLLKNVYQIPPAHFMTFSMTDQKITRYWEPDLSVKETGNLFADPDELESILKKAVSSQLISDVEVGCQLSGGIDSSLITTFARPYFPGGMNTFSVIPENSDFSEEDYIDQVIEKTESNAHKIEITPQYWVENICSATYHIDVPLSFPHALGIKRMAERAKDYVKVLLSGEGSDELMGGYREFYRHAYRQCYPGRIRLMSKIPFRGKRYRKYFLPHMSKNEYFIRIRSSHFNHAHSVKNDINDSVFFTNQQNLIPDNPDSLKNIRVYDMRGRLAHLLSMQDRMTMAYSIENRVPFLDKNVIDYVFSKPSEYFLQASNNPKEYKAPFRHTKMLLKKIAAKYYNSQFAYRNKIGFNQPIYDYMIFPQMKEMINDIILPGIRNRGVFNYDLISKTYKKMEKKSYRKHSRWLWSFFAFELWAQIFIDRKLSP